jgi:uncharacterized protein (DUF1330 family)
MTVVALLAVRRDMLAAFQAYERAAASIMARHGGAIDRVIALAPEGEHHREIHVVSFPSPAAWDAYRADPALAALSTDRAAVIVSTQVWIGADAPAYR